MQAYVRGVLARKQTRSLREQKAAVNIQTAWRRYKMRQQYNMVLHNITAVQVGCTRVRSPCHHALSSCLPLRSLFGEPAYVSSTPAVCRLP